MGPAFIEIQVEKVPRIFVFAKSNCLEYAILSVRPSVLVLVTEMTDPLLF